MIDKPRHPKKSPRAKGPDKDGGDRPGASDETKIKHQKAAAGFARILAEGPSVELDWETQDAMLDMAFDGELTPEDFDRFVELYPEAERQFAREMILDFQEQIRNPPRTYQLEPDDIVMVAKDREFPATSTSELPDFERCVTSEAVEARVVAYDATWLIIRMPDGTTERLIGLGFAETGRCETCMFRVHPRHEDFRAQGMLVDFAAPQTRVFHVDVFQDAIREEAEHRVQIAEMNKFLSR